MNILKKLCFLLCFNYFASISFGQVTLEYTFPTSSTSAFHADFEYINESTDLYIIPSANNQLKLYNSDYTLYKTINLNLPSGYSLQQAYSIGKHIINTDDKVELSVSAINSNAFSNQEPNNYSTMLIINEDGQVIHNFGYNYLISFTSLIRTNNQLKLALLEYHQENNNTTTYHYSVYSCSGNYSPEDAVSEPHSNSTMHPFPNPTMSRINLPYKLEEGKTSSIRIYNLNGQLMDTFNIGSDFEFISIDVSNYAKGVYVYEYNGISNKFVVQ